MSEGWGMGSETAEGEHGKALSRRWKVYAGYRKAMRIPYM
jgi:hypothetical protein